MIRQPATGKALFQALFEPKSVALIGATARPDSVGGVVARNLRCAGFAASN